MVAAPDGASRCGRSRGDTDIGVAVTIVVPAWNEAARIEHTLDELLDGSTSSAIGPLEVVVVDDGSVDDTALLVERRARSDGRLRLVRTAHRGKGAASREGFAAGTGELVVLVDADLPTPVAELHELVVGMGGADLVVGSRRLDPSRVEVAQPVGRRVGAATFRGVVRSTGLASVSDPQCGVKVLRRSTMEAVVSCCASPRFAFDLELIELTRRSGLVVVERPVTWRHVEGSTLRPLRDGVRAVLDVIAVRRRLTERR